MRRLRFTAPRIALKQSAMNRTAGSSYTLRALRINNAALKAAELPRRIKLLDWGTNESTKGNVIVNALTVAALPRNQRAKGYETVAIDFDHNSLPGSDTYEKGKAIEIAGYGTPQVIADDGLWLDAIQWTPAGEKFARNYKDLSPAPGLTDSGEVVFLHSAALTPNGSVYDLELFSVQPSASKPSTDMPEKALTLVAFTTLLGLPETATEAELQAKLKPVDLKPIEDKIAALTARFDSIPTDAAKPHADLLGQISALTAKVSAIEASRTQDGAAREQSERDQLISEASRDGKVIPLTAETLKLVPMAALREMVGKLPKNMVPMSARGNATGDTITGNVCAFSAAVQTKVKAGKTKATAIGEAVRENPAAYREYRELGAPAL
jgi:phage I-like protein